MKAEDARNMMSHNRAMDYIAQEASQGKSRVDIPKEYVDRRYLEQQGYRIVGDTHQLADYLYEPCLKGKKEMCKCKSDQDCKEYSEV